MKVANNAGRVAHRRLIRQLTLILTVLIFAFRIHGQCLDPSFSGVLNVQAGGPGSDGASGDVNGDGRIDVIVPNFSTNTISILLGQASGKPTTILLTTIQRPVAVGIGDFNRDGKPDLAVSHGSPPDPIGVSILLGNGTGSFAMSVDVTTSQTRPLVVADFNNDGNAKDFLDELVWMAQTLKWGRENVPSKFHSAAPIANG